jgi:hypothetical protein
MRITVGDVLGWRATGMTHEGIFSDYPELTEEDIRACLAYTADRERRLTTVVAPPHEAAHRRMKLLFDQKVRRYFNRRLVPFSKHAVIHRVSPA